MNTYAKAGFATAITLIPIAIKTFFTEPTWTVGAIVLYSVFVYVGSLKLFQPDERFLLVRNPTLDAAFQLTFEEHFPSENGSESAIRVHVFQPKRKLLFWRVLSVAYSYKSNITQADHGMEWPEGHGLCWKVFNSGEADWCHRNDVRWNNCNLTEKEQAATKDVFGVFAIPLRRPTTKEMVHSEVTAVLAFDALSEAAAEALKEQFDRFKSRENKKLVDRAAWVSIYFQ